MAMNLKLRLRDRYAKRLDKAWKRFEALDAKLLYTEPHDPEWDDVERERTRAITRLRQLERQ